MISLRSLAQIRVTKSGRILATAPKGIGASGSDGFIRLDSYAGPAQLAGTVAPKPHQMVLPDLGQVGTAKLGGQMKIRVVSIPGEQVVLAVAGRGANIPLGAIGILKLDPVQIVLVGIGKTSNVSYDPRIEFTFQVPSNPALSGLPLFWQAMVNVSFRGNQPKFTNVFITSIR